MGLGNLGSDIETQSQAGLAGLRRSPEEGLEQVFLRTRWYRFTRVGDGKFERPIQRHRPQADWGVRFSVGERIGEQV